ncbi:MAG TPA: NADH-quinone oxidoreductase subunit 15 [Deinococcales bacterium]|nr:NADH-quinone oxidoreductase subunit 15 [Deinococcales bacterium]
MSVTHAQETDNLFYSQWAELIGRLQDYAGRSGLRLDKEADFTRFIYRMERPYVLPTTVQTVSVGLPDGTPVLVISAAPPIDPVKSIQVRLQGGHQEWHLHPSAAGLVMEGGAVFDEARMTGLFDRVFAAKGWVRPA